MILLQPMEFDFLVSMKVIVLALIVDAILRSQKAGSRWVEVDSRA